MIVVSADSVFFFFLMIRRPPRSTLDRSSAASDVYKRQRECHGVTGVQLVLVELDAQSEFAAQHRDVLIPETVSYTHLRAHETVLDLVCRLLLEKKKNTRSHRHLLQTGQRQHIIIHRHNRLNTD